MNQQDPNLVKDSASKDKEKGKQGRHLSYMHTLTYTDACKHYIHTWWNSMNSQRIVPNSDIQICPKFTEAWHAYSSIETWKSELYIQIAAGRGCAGRVSRLGQTAMNCCWEPQLPQPAHGRPRAGTLLLQKFYWHSSPFSGVSGPEFLAVDTQEKFPRPISKWMNSKLPPSHKWDDMNCAKPFHNKSKMQWTQKTRHQPAK